MEGSETNLWTNEGHPVSIQTLCSGILTGFSKAFRCVLMCIPGILSTNLQLKHYLFKVLDIISSTKNEEKKGNRICR